MAATTPAETNKSLVEGLYEAINEQDDSELLKRYANDCVIHGAPDAEGEVTGRDAVTQYLQRTREAFPDLTATIEAMIAEDELVAARLAYTATHEGDYLGVPATGTTVRFEGINVFRIQDGEIAEVWPMIDTLGVLQQLGAVEAPGG